MINGASPGHPMSLHSADQCSPGCVFQDDAKGVCLQLLKNKVCIYIYICASVTTPNQTTIEKCSYNFTCRYSKTCRHDVINTCNQGRIIQLGCLGQKSAVKQRHFMLFISEEDRIITIKKTKTSIHPNIKQKFPICLRKKCHMCSKGVDHFYFP